ncbi:MBL fold metallo-hydrolase [Actinacidiphila guanduensis]|jgi:glyoxylase-like metal-dependent hydrolase (beta-lactamase superfamily II)|uniref:Metallo-beta-lactamase domain-containing protein n=1 Tax=Actinacidiphila guanduensis TaxID=310781 RepID=A0A1G9VTM6_9ACTN|nr:hypothetical protein [Actinacidiphila guanduensis]SDM75327.1 hypothetical protein SAMN05216259_101393 [Actinacidiphila guanduensis]
MTVYSHSHADHIGAAGLWGKEVERIGHIESRRLLRREADTQRPAPETQRQYMADLTASTRAALTGLDPTP